MRIAILLLLSVTLNFLSVAQDQRIRPGKLYNSGEKIISPKYGFTATIPEGWSGFLPQGTEVFSLAKNDGTSGQVVLFARENSDLETLEAFWKKGGDLSSSIRIKATETQREGDMTYAEVTAEGENINKSFRGFIIGKCGPYGPCISLFMITPAQFYESIRDELLSMMRAGSFSEPGDSNPYSDFDWQRFLSNKILVNYELQELSKSQNTIYLCVDGSFTSNVKRSGWFKEGDMIYKGRNTGNWSVSGTGPETILRLEFKNKKLPPLEVPLSISDEKIFANGERYYAGYSQKCR